MIVTFDASFGSTKAMRGRMSATVVLEISGAHDAMTYVASFAIAFVDPNDASKVTIIANYIPLEERPAVRTSPVRATMSSTRSRSTTTATPSRTSRNQFRFRTILGNPNTFLYNTGPDNVADQPIVEHAAALLVTRVAKGDDGRSRTVLGTDLVSAAGPHRASIDTELP